MKKANKNKKTNENLSIKNRLVEAANINQNELCEKYNSTPKGIINEEFIEQNREKFGTNKLSKKKKGGVLRRIWDSFFNPFSLILILLSIVSLVTDIILPLTKSESAEPWTVIIIITMVLISGILHFVEETRSSASAEKLVKMVQTTTRVERNGIAYEIPLEEVVVGDIIVLAAGDIIPADVRILSATDLFVSQSQLTGESDSIEKFPNLVANYEYDNVTDYHNLAFMGSNIISGSAKAMVVVTGNQTFLGQIAQKVNEKATKTDFEKGIKAISWLLIRIMLVAVPLVLIITGTRASIAGEHHKWVDALLFAISVAIGLTPEMLPMIITSTLAKGAMSMSKKRTIVKSLNSIQNFGAMDVFCTDKTGTLTLDQVVLERHLDVRGLENLKVLKYGFLNSYYQTGLKNLLDISIINKTDELSDIENELRSLENIYKKVDEIPFDFVRKRMSVVVKSIKSGKTQLITKGAVEEILSICSKLEYNDEVVDLDDKMIQKVLMQVDKLNDQGMRVIAVARKSNPGQVGKFGVGDEKDMILIGYLAFLDPPKESTKSAIENLHNLGVDVKILTGDNARVTKAICSQVGIPSEKIMLGKDLIDLSDQELQKVANEYNIYAKLSPDQKARVISALRNNGHAVGYMGDGINDAPAMKVADVSISVDTAVDIAKESANIILLEKDLNVLATGIVEGRKTYANMNKYVKMTVSSNFGNIISMILASILIPFVPLMAIQVLFLNLIYDFACGTIPWDRVDSELITKPRKWNAKSILRFMLWFGPVSSFVDILAFILLYYVFIPYAHPNVAKNSEDFKMLFWTGWFIISMWTQSLIIHFIRTEKVPFIQSRPAFILLFFSIFGSILITITPYIPGLNTALKVAQLNPWYFVLLIASIILYILLVLIVKRIYIKKYKELL
ncbi:magnesium-translocating P-type ATPase [Mycoplasmopsis caviae]|uniref:Magnesium-transporting ATPase, P-type 1 n=1 Tax=Mycoplasmopsis caviae TaxID=55603 RepID=A0A3P8MET2_9BACT|nr:magnesium-translocating P-type ATPase [Mycoplasmopsis caviae]UUD34895.1 magnesium-translocating P-type ATPase [Mycoplasmopsis caviae]VDR42266.1 Magnesium-transporting ATPase, P-type 1 [Mycoplasmopsis caviae]